MAALDAEHLVFQVNKPRFQLSLQNGMIDKLNIKTELDTHIGSQLMTLNDCTSLSKQPSQAQA